MHLDPHKKWDSYETRTDLFFFWNQNRFNWTERKPNTLIFLFLLINRALVVRKLFTSYLSGTDSFMLKQVLLLSDSHKPQFFFELHFRANHCWDIIRKHWSSSEQNLSFDAFDGFLRLNLFLLDQWHKL